MSASVAFATAVGTALKANAGVTALVGQRIYDGRPANVVWPFISLGVSTANPERVDCVVMRTETLQIDVWVAEGGKVWPARQIVDAVVAALDGVKLVLAEPHAVSRCDVVLARVMDDPDPMVAHGVVTLEAGIESHG